jgi:hypothetical protein
VTVSYCATKDENKGAKFQSPEIRRRKPTEGQTRADKKRNHESLAVIFHTDFTGDQTAEYMVELATRAGSVVFFGFWIFSFKSFYLWIAIHIYTF